MKNTVHYDGYLIEKKLGEVLSEIINLDKYEIRKQYRVNKQRCDFMLVDTETNKPMIAYEFDGPQHYQSSHAFSLDREKDSAVRELGAILIRVPYFVQLREDTLDYFFPNIDLTSTVEYPHGFIDRKAPLPTTFTDEGLHFFCHQLSTMPESVGLQIWNSMVEKGVDASSLKFWPKFAFVLEANKVHNNAYDYSELPAIVPMF